MVTDGRNLYKMPTAPGFLGATGWIYMLSLGLGVVAANMFATQYGAGEMGYAPQLGEPILWLGKKAIYAPYNWLIWLMMWRNATDPALTVVLWKGGFMAVLGSIFMILLTRWVHGRRHRTLMDDNEDVHGSAHWATPIEVKDTGLIGQNTGVYVGGWRDPRSEKVHYLRHDGPEHIMAFAPTRSGKGVGLILPTLLAWPESTVVYDIKGENWALTAGWRRDKANNIVIKFDPSATDGSTARFNPLMEIRIGTEYEVSDAQNIAMMVVDQDGKGLHDHWTKTAYGLLVGAIIHVLYSEVDKTLMGCAKFLSDPTRSMEETLYIMLQSDHDELGARNWVDPEGRPTRTHPVVADTARDMLNRADAERSGVLSTAKSFLTLFMDPVVGKNTSVCDFSIYDLMNSEKPISLYLVVPPSDADRLRPLIRLVITQIIRNNTREMKFEGGRSVKGYKHRLLLMLDEFPSLKKLEVFQEALAYIAGYGMKAYLIIQDISQLHEAYGKDESIFGNCHIRICYTPNKLETAKMISDMAGVQTIKKANITYSGGRSDISLKSVQAAVQEMQRPLATPDEVMRLPGPKKNSKGEILEAGAMLVFVAGHAPIYGQQILYFLDPTFSERSKMHSPAESERIENPRTAAALLLAKQRAAQQAAGGAVSDTSDGNTPNASSMASMFAEMAARATSANQGYEPPPSEAASFEGLNVPSPYSEEEAATRQKEAYAQSGTQGYDPYAGAKPAGPTGRPVRPRKLTPEEEEAAYLAALAADTLSSASLSASNLSSSNSIFEGGGGLSNYSDGLSGGFGGGGGYGGGIGGDSGFSSAAIVSTVEVSNSVPEVEEETEEPPAEDPAPAAKKPPPSDTLNTSEPIL